MGYRKGEAEAKFPVQCEDCGDEFRIVTLAFDRLAAKRKPILCSDCGETEGAGLSRKVHSGECRVIRGSVSLGG